MFPMWFYKLLVCRILQNKLLCLLFQLIDKVMKNYGKFFSIIALSKLVNALPFCMTKFLSLKLLLLTEIHKSIIVISVTI